MKIFENIVCGCQKKHEIMSISDIFSDEMIQQLFRKYLINSMLNDLGYSYPPSIQSNQDLNLVSKRHREANKIFRKLDFQSAELQRCECCGKFIGKQPQTNSFRYDVQKQLQFLGPGVPMLFIFTQNAIMMLFGLICILAIYALISNIQGNSCDKLTTPCTNSVLNYLSISNKLLNQYNFSVQIYLILAMTTFWIIANQFGIYRCRKIQEQQDIDMQTPSDYAIIIEQIPSDTTNEDIMKMVRIRNRELTQDQQRQTNNLQIHNIIMPAKLSDYFDELERQEKQYKKMIEEGSEEQFKFNNIPNPTQNSSIAIVVFKKQKSKQFFMTSQKLFLHEVQSLLCSWGVSYSQFQVNQATVSIHRAPQPDDIIWKNAERTSKEVYCNKLKSLSFGVIILFVGGTIQYFLAKWQVEESTNNGTNISLTAIISSLVVTLTNYIIGLILVWTTQLQGNITYTKQNRSLNLKVCYFQFLNAGIFYTLTNVLAISFKKFTLTDTFSTNVTTFMIINALEPALVTLVLDYIEFPQNIKRYLLKKNFMVYSQKEANKIYEYPSCDIPYKYAYVIKTLLLTFFYTPFVPVVSLISICGLVLYYYVIKFLFRHCYKLPNFHSSQVNRGSLRISALAPLALNLGQLFIYLYNYQQFDISNNKIFIYLSLSISIACVFSPWFDINTYLFPAQIASTNEDYDEMAYSFQITYKKAYPIYNQTNKIMQRDTRFIRYMCKDLVEIPPILSKICSKNLINTLQSHRRLVHTD